MDFRVSAAVDALEPNNNAVIGLPSCCAAFRALKEEGTTAPSLVVSINVKVEANLREKRLLLPKENPLETLLNIFDVTGH